MTDSRYLKTMHRRDSELIPVRNLRRLAIVTIVLGAPRDCDTTTSLPTFKIICKRRILQNYCLHERDQRQTLLTRFHAGHITGIASS